MNNGTWNELPRCRCPLCEWGWQADDWYEWDVGHVMECPHCHATLEITDRDVTVEIELQRVAAAAEAGKE